MKILLYQDDASPDNLEYFLDEFKSRMGYTLQEFKNKATKEVADEGYSIYWRFENYVLEIHADDPNYKLSMN